MITLRNLACIGLMVSISMMACCQHSNTHTTKSTAKYKNTKPDEGRNIFSMNSHWAFFKGDLVDAEKTSFSDKDWVSVSIPHTMQLEKKHNGGNFIYQGIGWYRRYLTLSNAYKGKRITLQFDGVQKNCEVFFNGKKLAEHKGGYIGFVIEITNEINFDADNVLALRVSNLDDEQTPPGKPQAGLDFYYYGGIYRDVKLIVTNGVYISDPLEANKVAGGGVFITYPKVSKEEAEVNIKTHIVNRNDAEEPITLITSIITHQGKEVATSTVTDQVFSEKEFIQTLKVVQPDLWHPDHPSLYTVLSRVVSKGKVLDEVRTTTGIRTLSFHSPTGQADGFYLNGEKLYLRGVNRHQSYQTVGDAAANSMQYRDALQIKNGGFNAVRASHYPQSPAFLNACDELGLLVIECEPGWQFFRSDSVFIKNTYQQVREMIRRDRNRPSIFLWETSLNESPASDSWAREIVKIAHQEMPGNQFFTADDFFAKGRKYYDVSYKVINEDGTDPMPEMPSLTREWGDTWIADPEKENGLRSSRRYTAKGLLAQCMLRQNALNGCMLEEEGAYWDHAKLDANKRICGYFLWSYNDYTRGTDTVTAFSGVVDIDRYEKFGYHQLRAMQDARNPVYGPMIFIASYNNLPDLDTSINIFSNCDKVRLYRNNKLIGEKTREANAITAPFIAAKGGSPYYSFRTNTFEPGELRAEGWMNNKVVCTHHVKTPETPDHLEIEIAEAGVKPIANGSDMVAVYIKVCDKNGTIITNTKPRQSYPIAVKAEGAGKIIGEKDMRAGISTQNTEGGIAYAILRTSLEAGTITVTASSPGLKSAKAKITTIPNIEIEVPDGNHVQWANEYEHQIDTVQTSKAITLLEEIKLSASMISFQQQEMNSNREKLVDSKTSTLWIAGKKVLPVVLTIDLGEFYLLEGSRITWGKDSDWYTYSMKVSADGSEWITVIDNAKVSGQNYKPQFFEQPNVRFVSISVSAVQPESSKVAISDLVLYGKK